LAGPTRAASCINRGTLTLRISILKKKSRVSQLLSLNVVAAACQKKCCSRCPPSCPSAPPRPAALRCAAQGGDYPAPHACLFSCTKLTMASPPPSRCVSEVSSVAPSLCSLSLLLHLIRFPRRPCVTVPVKEEIDEAAVINFMMCRALPVK
jgi:hypothetical protein